MTPPLHVRLLAVLLISAGVLRAESVPNGDFEKQDGPALAAWEPGRAFHRLARNTDAGTGKAALAVCVRHGIARQRQWFAAH